MFSNSERVLTRRRPVRLPFGETKGTVRWSIIRRCAMTLPYCVAELSSYL